LSEDEQNKNAELGMFEKTNAQLQLENDLLKKQLGETQLKISDLEAWKSVSMA